MVSFKSSLFVAKEVPGLYFFRNRLENLRLAFCRSLYRVRVAWTEKRTRDSKNSVTPSPVLAEHS